MKKRILLGMSGGVDSSVAACLLKQQGFEVVGVTLRLYDYRETLQETESGKKECHPEAFIEDAKSVARHLDIEHHVLDRRELFRDLIVDPFQKAYEKGKTPLPCVTCNRDVKTSALYDIMDDLQVQQMSTGHYVRDVVIDQTVQLHKGSDPIRDQSFFLFALTFDQLQKLTFPLGHFSKDQTRLYAQENGLTIFAKAASQDLCFISKKDYRSFFTGQEQGGYIKDTTGKILGKHKGIRSYTIGQRQGLGIGGTHEPLYVIDLNHETSEVIVGQRSLLAKNKILLEKVNWLSKELPFEEGKQYTFAIKLRSAGNLVKADVVIGPCNTATILLEEPEYGIANGQVAVFYQGTRLMGGGFIVGAHMEEDLMKKHAN